VTARWSTQDACSYPSPWPPRTTIRIQPSAKLDLGAERCLEIVLRGDSPPPARLVWFRGVDGEQLRLEVIWDPDVGRAFQALPASEGTRAMSLDPWASEQLDAFIARHEVEVTARRLGARAVARRT